MAAVGQTLGDYRLVLSHRGFRLLFFGQSLSQIGDWLTNVALAVLVYDATASAGAVAMLFLARMLPRVLLYPIAGVVVDRADKRRLMIAVDLARAGLALGPLLVPILGSVWPAYVSVLALQALSTLFNPARGAVVPHLVPRERLSAANALNGAASEAAFFVGPALGGLLVSLGGPGPAFVADSGTFLVSALLLWLLPLQAGPAGDARPRNVQAELAEGLRAVATNPDLRAFYLALGSGAWAMVTINALMVVVADRLLGLPSSATGFLYAAVGLGTLAGTVVQPVIGQRLATLHALVLWAGLQALGVLCFAVLAPFGLLAALALLFLIGVSNMALELTGTVVVQRSEGQVGRLFGLLFWVVALGLGLGSLTVGPLERELGVQGALVLAGALTCIFVLALPLVAAIPPRVPGRRAAAESAILRRARPARRRLPHS